MTDAIAISLTVILPVVVVFALAGPARTWAADHPHGARRSALLGGVLGIAVVAYWAGRFLAIG